MKNHLVKLTTVVLTVATLPLLAQTEASLIGTGYAAPAPVELAPGQVVTLFFHGVKPLSSGGVRSGQAQSVPLPYEIAGLSLEMLQVTSPVPFRLPVLAVRQHNECEEPTGRPICLLTAIRVQVPFELTSTITKLVLKEDGQASRTFLVRPVRDNFHIITSCDLEWDTNPGSACERLAFHSNGQKIDRNSPAAAGEQIILYAFGGGPTMPASNTGNTSPAGARVIDAVSRQVRLRYEVLRNASPSLPRYADVNASGAGDEAAFVGLTGNQVGLYQINAVLPSDLSIPIACGGDTRTNVVMKVHTSQGVENVPICVQP